MSERAPQLPTAQEVLVSFMATTPGYLYWKDNHERYRGCNDYHAFRLGYKHGKEVIGKRDEQLITKEELPRFSHYDHMVLLQGQTRIIEEAVTLRGQTLILLSLKSPILGKYHQVVGVLNISLDITRERRLEEQLRAYKKSIEADPH